MVELSYEAIFILAVCLVTAWTFERQRAANLLLQMLAKEALDRTLQNTIDLQALKNSTHSVYPVPAGDLKDFESKISQITGPGQQDFDKDLAAAGYGTPDSDDLV